MIVHSASPWGNLTGAPLCALDHAKNMAPDYGGELVLCGHGPLEDKARELGVPIWCSPFLFMGLRHARPLRFLKNVGRVAASRIRYVIALARHLRRHPGILHIHSRAAHLPYALLAGRLAGVPMAMTLHEPWIGGFEEWWHLVLMRAARIPVVCLSQAMVSQYPKLLRTATIIPNALRTMPEPRPRRVLAGRPPVIGMVGTMIPEKGLDLCLETCRLLKERGLVFELRLVGRWTREPVRKQADDFIARHGLSSRGFRHLLSADPPGFLSPRGHGSDGPCPARRRHPRGRHSGNGRGWRLGFSRGPRGYRWICGRTRTTPAQAGIACRNGENGEGPRPSPVFAGSLPTAV